jgi:hypothetical protein
VPTELAGHVETRSGQLSLLPLPPGRLGPLNLAVVVAVVTVRMVEVISNEVINVIAVGYGLMPAARAVDVVGIMPVAGMGRGTVRRIRGAYFKDVLVDVISVEVMEVAVVKIIDVVTMTNGCMAAAGSMLMVMTSRMLIVAVAHGCLLSRLGACVDGQVHFAQQWSSSAMSE